MAVTSNHAPTGRWLTTLGKDAVPGSEHTLSIGNPLLGGEFTTYRLGPVVAQSDFWDEPMFNLKEADIKIDGSFHPYKEIMALIEDQKYRIDAKIALASVSYGRTGWGHWAAQAAA